MKVKLVPCLLLILLLGCSEKPQTTQENPRAKGASSAASAQNSPVSFSLVFFLDPNGGPCRMQDSILRGMSEELRRLVDLRYVQTTVPSDLNDFYAFGIRGLPTLLLVDESGKEIRRLPPGVKSANEIREFLRTIPGR